MRRYFILIVMALLFAYSSLAYAQFGGITVPPNGDNQHSITTQYIGPVAITIDYNSPNVHAPDGTDRRGKIWGTLVPYGMGKEAFGTCGDQCPWRGGANENTIFKTSHDIKVQGEKLPAGSYGMHFLAGQQEWTIIFSKNYTSWGSFSYDPKEDALRVKAKPEKSEYHEWLTYDFIDRETNHATVALKWEDLQVPFKITVENIEELYIAKIDEELRNSAGFTWQNFDSAALYTLQAKKHMDKGLQWAEKAVNFAFVGQENFTTLMTLGQLQEANGQTAESKKSFEKALNHRTAGPIDIHQYGRNLQAANKTEEAIRIFELNAKKFPNQWPTEVGLMRALSAKGNYKEALKHAKLALAQAPNDQNRTNLQNMIKTLEQGKDVN
jgi:Protein of unknown function (DUF2911)